MKPGQISNTAAFIAIKFYGLTRWRKFCSLFDDEVVKFYEELVHVLPFPSNFYHRLLKINWARKFFVFWEELLLPGDLMHVLMRKWYFHQMIAEMRKDGYEQLLVIGAGFDHLATFFSQKGMKAVELDAPRMVAVKREFLARRNYLNPNLTIAEAFFSLDSLQKTLTSKTQLDPNKKTIVVAEGLFDYLSPDHASELLQEITEFFNNTLVLCSTIFSLYELSGVRSFVYDKSIKLAGENLKLHMDKSQYSRFLNQHGFTIDETVSYNEMEQEMLEKHDIELPILKGFYMLRAHYERDKTSKS